MTEPVATLPACLCGLDTNPVTSPRMDVHCLKHDAPEAAGELPCPLCRKPMNILENGQAWCRNLIENPNDYAEWAEGSCLLACHSVTLPIGVWRAVNAAHADTRVSQPAGEPGNVDCALGSRDNDGSECEKGFCPKPRTCFHYCHEHHESICMAGHAQSSSTPVDEEVARELENWFGDWLNREDYGDREQLQRCWNAAVRCASALSSTPSDEVAQRARAVKIRTAAEDVWNKFWNDLTSDGWSVDDLEAILRLHFTATDVERETCAEHEK